MKYNHQTGELFVRKWVIPSFTHGQPLSIDKIHPEKYYLAGIRGLFVGAPYDYSENTEATPDKLTIRFPVKEENIEKYCKEMGKKIGKL